MYPRLSRRRYSAAPSSVVSSLPPDCIPVSFDPDHAPGWRVLKSPSLFPSLPIPLIPSSFPGFLSSLDLWESDLLAALTLNFDPFKLMQLLLDSTTFFGVSNGSVAKHRGTFGWAISLPCGTRLASCSGSAYGFKPTSFRSEGYGMLSLTRFILRLFEFCGYPIPAGINLATDNEGLIARIASSRQSVTEHPNATLKPDWDVVRSIADTLLLFPSPKIEHVTGHQDDEADYCDLPLVSQLNIDADKLAGEVHSTPSLHPASVIRLAANPAQFHIGKATITSRIKSVVRRAATAPALREHIRALTSWSPTIFDSVDWISHGQAIRRCYHKKTFVVKFLHNLLPTGKRVHRYDPTYSHRCPSCQDPHEDRAHLLRCPEPTRFAWVNELFTALRARCTSLLTCESLVSILLHGLESWLTDTPFPLHQFPTAALQPLIRQQESIGWDQLFLGRFGTEWSHLQSEHLRQINNQSKHLNGSSWILAITTLLWDHVSQVWENRNKARHGTDKATTQIARSQQALRETSALYDRRQETLAKDDFVFHKTFALHQVLENTAHKLSSWLRTWRPVILWSIRNAKQMALTQVPTLQSLWYPEAPTPTPSNFSSSDNNSLPDHPD